MATTVEHPTVAYPVKDAAPKGQAKRAQAASHADIDATVSPVLAEPKEELEPSLSDRGWPELSAWLIELQLEEYIAPATAWADEADFVEMEDVVWNLEDLAATLNLKAWEWSRLE